MAGYDQRIRGLKNDTETHQSDVYRNAKPVIARTIDLLHSKNVLTGVIGMFAAFAYVMPAIGDIAIILAFLFTWWGLTRQEDVPLKLPIQSGMLDPKLPKPAPMKGFNKAAGIFYLGNDKETNKEIWLTNDDCRQHMLVLGTTGAGKTETLLGFVANALTWQSGFLFCDGKGDVALFAKVYALARQFGREDDILVLNFMTGNRDLGKSGGEILSNTLNPFATGSSDGLTQMVVSLMDDAGGDGAMWKGRATAMFTGVMRALCWLRDQDVVDLNVGTIRDYLNLRAIIDLGDPKKYPEMPQSIRKSVRSYMTSLPGFQEDKGYKQAQTTLDQHGYLEMQFTKILGSLADVYGHIFFTAAGEVDMHDVVLNRRILVIMLPALEKAGDEIANLGKIVVANLKGMMGATLGSTIQGTWDDVVEKRPTTSSSPFLVLLDEVGYYTVEGMALMTAQARSLGFGMILASQDIPAMKKLNEKEAASIIANTNTKVFMRLEEMEQSVGLATQSGGKGFRTQISGFSGQSGEFSGVNYRDSLEASVQEVDRINPRDIRSLKAGEMIVVHQDHIIHGRAFYANPEGSLNKKKLKLTTNHFIKVPKPSVSDIEQAERIPEVVAKLVDPDFLQRMVEEDRAARAKVAAAAESDEIALAVSSFDTYRENNRTASAAQATCAAVANVVRTFGGLGNALGEQMRTKVPSGGIDASDLLDSMPPMTQRYLDDDMDAPPSRPERMPPPSELLGDDDFMPGRSDDLDMLEDMHFGQPPKQQGFAQGQGLGGLRRKSVIHDVEHGVRIEDKRVDDVSQGLDQNDAVLRMLADLDVNPETITTDELDANIQESLGAYSDLDYDNVASSEEIDSVAAQSEKIRENQALTPEAQEGFISEFLDSLIEGAYDESDD